MDVFREFTFEAAHRLPYVPEGHKCARLHGHSFRVEVHVQGDVDPATGHGHRLRRHQGGLRAAADQLDHYFLNEVDGLDNPTSENLARWIWDRLAAVLALAEVVVRETCTSGVAYRGDGR